MSVSKDFSVSASTPVVAAVNDDGEQCRHVTGRFRSTRPHLPGQDFGTAPKSPRLSPIGVAILHSSPDSTFQIS
jgi:hypothetical protein